MRWLMRLIDYIRYTSRAARRPWYIFIALPLMPVRFASDHSSITWDHRSTSGLIVLKFELNLSSFVNPWQSHGLAKSTVEGYWNIQWRRTERPRKSSTPMSKTLITPVQLWILLVVRNRHVVWMVFIIFLTRFSILTLGWVLLLWVNQKVSTVLQTQNLVKNLTKKK